LRENRVGTFGFRAGAGRRWGASGRGDITPTNGM